jgi:beta-glucosidase
MTLDEKIQELHTSPQDGHGLPGVPRLGLPALNMTNGPAGAANGGTGHTGCATALPAPISLAATWDVNLAYEYGSIVGSEAKTQANGLVFGPDINIARVPQNGRTFEAFGEDPYLTSQMAVAESKGIQAQGVIAEPKHYAANNQETNRLTINEIIDERTLREIYLPGFEAVVKQAGVGAIMCAYNRVNGSYACENKVLLSQILKDEWGFTGFVNSDSLATHSTVPAAKAGLDLEMPSNYFAAPLQAAVIAGQVPTALINEKLYRRFSTMKRLGVFDNPPALQKVPAQPHGNRARAIAAAGMVLLKNEGNLLPLDASRLHSIAVIGPFIQAWTGGGGSSKVKPLYTVTTVDGIQNRVESGVRVTSADGVNIPAAVNLAKSADVAILVLVDLELEGVDQQIALRGNQDQLTAAVAAANPRTVVVLKTGTVALMPWVSRVPSILEAWYPGEEDGNAVADVLFGDVNPSGKLPLTFPLSLDDLPANTPEQYPGVNGTATYSEGVFVGYRHYDRNNIAAAFPFGFGLSYTTFAYHNLVVSPANASFSNNPSQTVTVDFDIVNTGKRTGAEVAQLYVGIPSTAVEEPPQWLKGFAKLSLPAGQKGHVHLTLDSRAFSYWDVNSGSWQVASGDYEIMIGSSSRDIRLHGQVKLF